MAEQHRNVFFGFAHVADEKRHGACALDQNLAKRQHIVLYGSALEYLFDKADRLIRISLEPQNTSEKALGRRTLIEDEADHRRTGDRCLISVKHALHVLTRFSLPAQKVQDISDHPLTDIAIVRTRLALRKLREAFAHSESGPELTAIEKARPQAPQGTKLVVDIV